MIICLSNDWLPGQSVKKYIYTRQDVECTFSDIPRVPQLPPLELFSKGVLPHTPGSLLMIRPHGEIDHSQSEASLVRPRCIYQARVQNYHTLDNDDT